MWGTLILETVECAVLRELSYRPIFVSQIIKVLHTKKHMISLSKATKYTKGRISYDIHVPQNMKEGLSKHFLKQLEKEEE